MRKVKGSDAGQLYAMKVLKKATLKGEGSPRPSNPPQLLLLTGGTGIRFSAA